MNKLFQLLILCIFVAHIASIIGCGSSRQIQQEAFVWPQPPDEPRVQYIGTLRGESDFRIGLSDVLDVIAGSEGKN